MVISHSNCGMRLFVLIVWLGCCEGCRSSCLRSELVQFDAELLDISREISTKSQDVARIIESLASNGGLKYVTAFAGGITARSSSIVRVLEIPISSGFHQNALDGWVPSDPPIRCFVVGVAREEVFVASNLEIPADLSTESTEGRPLHLFLMGRLQGCYFYKANNAAAKAREIDELISQIGDLPAGYWVKNDSFDGSTVICIQVQTGQRSRWAVLVNPGYVAGDFQEGDEHDVALHRCALLASATWSELKWRP